MRIRVMVFVAVALVLAAIPLTSIVAHNQPGMMALSTAQQGGCTDKDFLTTVAKDFKDMSTQLTGLQDSKPDDLVKGSLVLAALRQKYEDMDKVPDGCFATQLSLIVVTANLGDSFTLGLAKLADPAAAADIDKSITNQSERIKKLLDVYKTTLGAAN